MKNWLKIFVAVILALATMFAFAACNNDDGDATVDPDDGGTTTVIPGGSDETEDLEEGFKVNFYYSYTAIVVNANDRTEEKNERKLVETIYVPYDNTGWSSDKLAIKDAISYNGYMFEAWYPEWDDTTQTGWNTDVKPQVAVGDPYNFDKPVTDDINLYAYKGVIAGENIVWDIVYEYQTDAAVAPTEVAENSHLVTFVSVDKTLNITNKVSLLTVSVPSTGWDSDLIAKKDAVKYNSYGFTDWYTDWDYDKMEAVGDAYNFDSAPEEDIVLYGVIGESDGLNEVTTKTKVEATLTLSGSGAMFDFANRSVVDVPWYDHRTEITKVIMDDEITYIGQNAFAGFKALAEIDFPEKVTKIGDFAFYEANSKTFKTLRLPENVTELGASSFAYTGLTQVYLNDGLTTISGRTFYGSNKIKFIVVPSSLTYIGIAAFHPGPGNYNGTPNAAHALSKVYYNGDESDLTRASADNTVTFAGLSIEIENEWFNQIPAIYSFKSNEGEITAEQTKSSWYLLADDEGLEYPAQYSYTVKYMLSGNLVPFAVDYVTIAPVLDAENNPVLDDNGDAMFQGTVSQANIDFKNNLMHSDGYGFYDFNVGSNPFELGSSVTEDRNITCLRYKTANGVSEGYLGGGITWTLNNGVLTVSPSTEDGDTNVAWNLTNSYAAATLWTNSAKGPSTITEIIVEEGVKSLGNYVFTGTAISDIVLPSSLEEIASNAFDNCTSLHSVYFAGNNINDSIQSLKLPKDARVYAKASEDSIGKLGAYWLTTDDGITTAWQISENGELYVGGDEIMKDYIVASDAPWYAAKDSIKSVMVSTNITDLADNLVSGYDGVTDITLHAKVKIVPESAFEGTGIVNALNEYKNGILVVDGVLLKIDPARRNTDFFATNSSINVIAEGAFSRCNNIKAVYISNSIKYINDNAFDESAIVERLYIDNSENAWKSAAVDFNYDETKIQILTSGYWRAQKGVYNIVKCNHVYGEYEPVSPSTCCVAGSQKRTCVFGDRCITDDYEVGPQVEISELPIDSTAHNFVDMTEGDDIYQGPTHEAEGYQMQICTNTSVTKDNEGNETVNTCGATQKVTLDKVPYEWGEYVENSDGTTETATCECDLCKDSENPSTDTRDIQTEDTLE